MYGSENVIWIKNVKRNNGEEWAYDDIPEDGIFKLNWPTKKRGSALTPKVGDIIILFQKPKKVDGKRNQKVHFTHLVSPISTDITVDENAPRHKWCRTVKLIAIANPIQAIPNPGYYNFFLPNRGLTNPIVNLVNNIGMNEAETQQDVWKLFSSFIRSEFLDDLFVPQEPQGMFGEVEGDKVIREHIRQELTRRNSRIVQEAKDKAFEKGNGRILCECCKFDFIKAYGEIGTRFIECHHKIHLRLGERITELEDLALVCSNCHRMLHKRNSVGEHYTVEELTKIVNMQNNTGA